MKAQLIIHFCLLMISFSYVKADIFNEDINQYHKSTTNALQQDSFRLYQQLGGDGLLSEELIKGHVVDESLRSESFYKGIRRFDMDESIKAMRNRYPHEIHRDVAAINRQISLMNLQYTSPAAMDIYKFLTTMAHLRLLMRVEQYTELESALIDPAMRLRKQAEYDCLKEKGRDLDGAFIDCYDKQRHVLEGLNNPTHRTYEIEHQTDVLAGLVKRITNDKYYENVKDILPSLFVSQEKINYQQPQIDLMEYFLSIKVSKFELMQEWLRRSQNSEQIKEEEFHEMNQWGMLMDQRILRQMHLLTSSERQLAMSAMAYRFAILKTKMTYHQLIELMQMILIAPYVNAGWHDYINGVIRYYQEKLAMFDVYVQGLDSIYQRQYQIDLLIDQRKEELFNVK